VFLSAALGLRTGLAQDAIAHLPAFVAATIQPCLSSHLQNPAHRRRNHGRHRAAPVRRGGSKRPGYM